MAKKTEYEHKGRVDIFTPKPPNEDDHDWVWGVAFVIMVILLLSSCS